MGIQKANIPWGTQVSLTESRRFLLLKAVLIPITTNTFFLSKPPLEEVEAAPDPSELHICCEFRVADNSICSIEIDLSRYLTNPDSVPD